MTHTIRTRSKAPFAIVYVGADGISLEGYAYTEAAARTRARRKGYRYTVAPIADGKITVTV